MIGNIVAAITGGLAEVGDFESIETVIVGAGGAADITFSNISDTYQHLQIRGICRSSATSGSAVSAINIQFNGDTATNYNVHQLFGDGSSVFAVAAANFASVQASVININTTTSNAFAANVIDILDYANINKFKTVRALSGVDLNGSGSSMLGSSAWRSTSAITSIRLYPANGNFSQHSHFALYGIRG